MRTEAIARFLTAKTFPDLAALYLPEAEVQVLVEQDGGQRVSGEFQGRNWVAWSDGVQQWKSFRIPLNAATDTPENNDCPMTFDLEEHAAGIGMTGWFFEQKVSKWVGFDFDAMTGHRETHARKLTDQELLAVQEAACSIPWVTVRKSTSGKGRHLYVFLDDFPTVNHNEHAALARAILSKMSAYVGFDFFSKVDTMGHILWQWHRKMEGTDGLSLLKTGEILKAVPDNWQDHLVVVSGKRVKNRPSFLSEIEEVVGDDADRAFDEITGQATLIQLDKKHKELIQWLESNNKAWRWDSDHHMLITHTLALEEAAKSLEILGPFQTISTGSSEVNCFAFPLRSGAWVVRRYSMGVAEAPTWSTDQAGWTRCFFNVQPDLKTVANASNALEHKSGGFVFHRAEEALKTAQALGIKFELPLEMAGRRTRIKENKDGRVIIEISSDPEDRPDAMSGWLLEGKNWTRVFRAAAQTLPVTETVSYDSVLRHLVTAADQNFGWVVRSDSLWRTEPLTHVWAALSSVGVDPKEAKQVVGTAVTKPWTLVNYPFKPEYPGDRLWNRDSAQLRFFPSENIDKLNFTHWNKILNHLGQGLDVAVATNPWCKTYGLISGADYLRVWVASLFQFPMEPLPYLFFYSEEQNTGKSIFHEALSLLMSKGVVRADYALTSDGNFNGELENAVLCVVEETDLRKSKSAYAKIKDWTTSRQLPIHKKGSTPYTVNNSSHWCQMSNDARACPVSIGDTRIVVIQVEPLDPVDLIPKSRFLALLEQEASDFMAAILSLEVPPSNDRLNVPIIETSAKERQVKSNLTELEVFFQEKVHAVDGKMIKYSELFDAFQEQLDPGSVHEWSKIRVGRELPSHAIKGRSPKDAQWYVGNVSWTPRLPDEPILPKLVLFRDTLVSCNEVKGAKS